MKPFHTLSIALLLVLFSACKKDLRIKTYAIDEMNGSGISGTLTMNETNDEKVEVNIEAKQLPVADTLYQAMIRGNVVALPADTVLEFMFSRSSGSKFQSSKIWDIKYDAMKDFDGCFLFYGPYPNDTLPIAGCNIGKNE